MPNNAGKGRGSTPHHLFTPKTDRLLKEVNFICAACNFTQLDYLLFIYLFYLIYLFDFYVFQEKLDNHNLCENWLFYSNERKGGNGELLTRYLLLPEWASNVFK